jgi:hypothetical protein
VWEIPTEIETRKELPVLMDHLKTLWSERVLARLAIPEVLEGGDEDPTSSTAEQAARTYADVEDVIAKGWPGKMHSFLARPSLTEPRLCSPRESPEDQAQSRVQEVSCFELGEDSSEERASDSKT